MSKGATEIDKQITTAVVPTALTPQPPPAVTPHWVLIVGASSGIGRSVARRWAQAGSNLVLAGRDVDDLNRSADDLRIRFGVTVVTLPFDALAFDTHGEFWQQCLANAGGALDGIIILHGQFPVQADGQADFFVARRAIDVNFTSVVSLLTLAANDFEKAGKGFICVFSSVAGDRGRQSNYVYGSAKAGLSAFLQGMRNRLCRAHVNVLTVKPGFVDTAMTWGLPGMFLVARPEQVADDVYDAVIKGRSEIYTPWFWRYIMMIIKSVPEVVFKRMKM